MIKKTLILIGLLLLFIGAKAQSWTVYPLYNGTFTDLVETPSKVYYSSNGSLFSYDKNTQETYAYSNANKLSDNLVSGIYYNVKNKYLLVVYQSTNMDVIYEDGRVVNLPEILNASLTVKKQIKSVNMLDDYICIATNFGYVLYDANKLVVKESRNWDKEIRSMTVWRGMIVVQDGYDTKYADKESSHASISDFKILRESTAASKLQVIGNELYFHHGSWHDNVYKFVNIDFESETTGNRAAIFCIAEYRNRNDWFKPSANGYYLVTDTEIINFDREGKKLASTPLPQLFQKSQIAKWDDDTIIWHGCSEGIGNFNIAGEAPTVLQEYYRPEGAVCQVVAYMRHSADGKRLYATSGSSMVVRPCNGSKFSSSDHMNAYPIQTTDMFEDGQIYDVSYNDLSDREFGPGGFRAGDQQLVEDPVDNDIYYLASRFDGVRVINRKTGEQIARWSQVNGKAPFTSTWGNNVYAPAFDKFNNLLVLSGMEPADNSPQDITHLFLLPAAKLRNPAAVTKADWQEFKLPSSYINDFECVLLPCQRSNFIVLQSVRYGIGQLFIDTRGTESLSDDRMIHLSSFTDQDGNPYTPTQYVSVAEDNNGKLWIGSLDGVIEVDPLKVFDADFRCNRIKVPRNDGTNYADYLLAGEQVNWISVDNANRKWIATQNSGLYLVSPTGNKIIEHFTTDNSPLSSNQINTVEASKVDNMVYIGTNYGTIAYASDASPAADNLDNVYAYPNPVRPDYTGWITINGLMENSLVKITDAQGSVIFQGKSEGGMVVWDGCNFGGERVRSGVYFVLASQNDGGSSFSAVTKIMVIN